VVAAVADTLKCTAPADDRVLAAAGIRKCTAPPLDPILAAARDPDYRALVVTGHKWPLVQMFKGGHHSEVVSVRRARVLA
jgi:hypothetical protein